MGKIRKMTFLKRRLQDFPYLLTLIVFELVAVGLTLKYVTGNEKFMVVVVIFVLFAHLTLYFLIALYLDKARDKHFIKEYTQIVQTYSETEDAELFLKALEGIESKPKTEQPIYAYSLSMSTALYKTMEK